MVVLPSSKPFAGVGVTYRHHEEAEAEGQHDDVPHEMLLSRCELRIRIKRTPLPLAVKCHLAHRFSRRSQCRCYRNLIKTVVVPANAGDPYAVPSRSCTGLV